MHTEQLILVQNALEFTKRMAEQYFVQRKLDDLSSFLDESVSWIGTGSDEISHNLEEALLALSRELQEYDGSFRLGAQKFQAVPRSDTLCIVYGTVQAIPEDPTLSEENLRLSLVLEQGKNGIKLIHLHFSHPDSDQEEGHYFVPKTARSNAVILRQKLDAHAKQLENLTKHIPGGAHQCLNDPNLTLLTMSDGFLSLFGYTREEIHTLFHDQFINMVYPGDRAELLRTIHDQLQSGRDIEVEYRALCKNGQPIWILDKGRLLDDGEGCDCFYCLLVDIDDRKREQETLRLSLERHQVIVDQATDIIFEWDIIQDSLQFSPNWRKKFGYDPIDSHISGRIPMSRNIHRDDMTAFVKLMRDTAAGIPYSEAEFRIRHLNGAYRWCRIRATTQHDSDARPIKAVGVIIDIDDEKKQRQALLDMAQRDALTGLYNKVAVASLVEQQLSAHSVNSRQALLILDIDHFKAVNDIYGHMAGDSLLSNVAAVLRGHVRSTDLVGRIGGDEFLVYLPEVFSEQAVRDKAEELRASLGLLTPEQGAPPITCSIGGASFLHGNADYATLYRYADLALYHSKKVGRDSATLYDSSLSADENEHPIALDADDFDAESSLADEQLAQYTFRMLYAAKDVESTIDRLLGIIGRSFDVSRAYIFESSPDGTCCSNTFEWCADGVESHLATLQNLSYLEDLGGYLDNFDERGLFYCPEVSDTHPDVRAVLEPQGIHSMLQCAMLDEGEFVGYVGFDECRENRAWSSRQVAAFKLTADVLSTFLIKFRHKCKLLGQEK